MPDRRILDWPTDVEELTAVLGVDEFDVAAHSSGGPYALACAHRLPERVQRVALISCVAPYEVSGTGQADEDLTRLAREDVAQAAREVARSAAWLVEAPERFLDLPRPDADRQLLNDPDIRSMFAATIREAVEQGVDAYAWECAVERLPWGFALDEMRPPVWIFQGEQDRSVPPSQARVLAALLPGSTLRVFPDEAHGLILAQWAEILRDLRCEHPTSSSSGASTAREN